MDSTVVRAEKIETNDAANRSSYLVPIRFRAAARPLKLALVDAVAAFLAGVVARLVIPVPPSSYFQTVDYFYIPLAVVSCFVAGLYDRNQWNPVTRLRMRARAVAGSSLAELMFVALKIPVTGLVLYIATRAALFFILAFYLECGTEARLGRSSVQNDLIQPLDSERRLSDRLKGSADFAVSLIAGVLALPFIAASAAAVWLIDRGPVFYSQKRIGQGGRIINVLKIRTMYVDAEQRLEERLREDPAARSEWERFFKLRDDPRVLGWVGRFLRRSSLDELPQLWNIFCGDMSLVGPRPFPPYHLDYFDESFRQKRQSCKPGLTGLWQVSARSNGDLEVQRALDLSYITNRSFWLDLYILLVTVPAVLKGTGAC